MTVVACCDTQAWVVNHPSDSISIVDLTLGATIRTLAVGDEPTDVVFAEPPARLTYPPPPPGIQRNPALNDPAPPAQPPSP